MSAEDPLEALHQIFELVVAYFSWDDCARASCVSTGWRAACRTACPARLAVSLTAATQLEFLDWWTPARAAAVEYIEFRARAARPIFPWQFSFAKTANTLHWSKVLRQLPNLREVHVQGDDFNTLDFDHQLLINLRSSSVTSCSVSRCWQIQLRRRGVVSEGERVEGLTLSGTEWKSRDTSVCWTDYVSQLVVAVDGRHECGVFSDGGLVSNMRGLEVLTVLFNNVGPSNTVYICKLPPNLSRLRVFGGQTVLRSDYFEGSFQQMIEGLQECKLCTAPLQLCGWYTRDHGLDHVFSSRKALLQLLACFRTSWELQGDAFNRRLAQEGLPSVSCEALYVHLLMAGVLASLVNTHITDHGWPLSGAGNGSDTLTGIFEEYLVHKVQHCAVDDLAVLSRRANNAWSATWQVLQVMAGKSSSACELALEDAIWISCLHLEQDSRVDILRCAALSSCTLQ